MLLSLKIFLNKDLSILNCPSIIIYFDLSGFAAGVLLIQASMPSAVLNYLIAAIYSPKTITDSVASTIVVSTIMSFITLPIVIFISLKYFPL